MNNISKNIAKTTLFTTLAVAALGCDSASFVADQPVSEQATFATQTPTSSVDSTSTAAPADDDVTLSDLSHTSTTVGEVSPMDEETTEETPDTTVAEEPLVEEAVVEETVAEESTTEEAPIAEIFADGSEPLEWTPNGTYKLPAYGSSCRFVTDDVVQIPSNGQVDDTMVFAATAGPDATFALTVQTPSGLSVSASVDMKRGLTGRSYRQAEGQATWSDKAGEHTGWVVDGTLCFDEKLANGMGDVLAEFSLIVQLDGVHYAMGGNVLIDGTQVSAGNGYAIDAEMGVDVDLR